MKVSNEFETAMVNEPSVFGALKFYCIIVLCFVRLKQTKRIEPKFIPVVTLKQITYQTDFKNTRFGRQTD